MEHVQQQLGRLPDAIVADAGYGSEENYAYLEQHRRTAVVKFNTYRLEKTRKWRSQIKRVENWTYDETVDAWICAADKRLRFIREKQEVTGSGYIVQLREVSGSGLSDLCVTRPPYYSDGSIHQREPETPAVQAESPRPIGQ